MLLRLINYFIEYMNNIYNVLKYFIKKNKNIHENTIHKNIYLFLHDISNQWKNNHIQNIDLLCDILNIYYKNKCNNDNVEKRSSEENKETYLKYYTLGWYMYHCIKKDNDIICQ